MTSGALPGNRGIFSVAIAVTSDDDRSDNWPARAVELFARLSCCGAPSPCNSALQARSRVFGLTRLGFRPDLSAARCGQPR